MPHLKIKVADYIFVGIILLAGLVGLGFNLQEAAAADHKYALVYVQNRPVAELSIAAESKYTYELRFGEEGEHSAFVEVGGGRIRMLPMDDDLCPRGICSHTGWIEYSYESIVCLPNQIMIIFSEAPAYGPDLDIDAVTY